jgi:lipopolysaccharide export system permease protein
MILWELVKIFVMSLVALTGLLLLAGIIAEASQRGLTPAQLLAVIPLIVPSTLPYTIPATTLFATCLVYGRMAHDNEIIAIKAAGINLLKVVTPCLFLGAVMSAVTMGLYYHFIPYSHTLLRTMFLKDVEEFLYTMLRNERCINHPKMNYAIWVQRVQGKRLINPWIKRRDAQGKYDMIAHAKEAELRVDVHNQKVLVHMKHGEIFSSDKGDSRATFDDRIWEVPLSDSPFEVHKMRRPGDLTWHEIDDRKAEVYAALAELDTELADALARPPRSRPDLQQYLIGLKMRRYFMEREVYALDTERQQRPAVSLGCLCFVLVGCPVGIWFSRSDYLSAFVSCFLPIVFLYYPLLLFGTSLSKDGQLSPAIAMWIADAVMAGIAVVLFSKLLKH